MNVIRSKWSIVFVKGSLLETGHMSQKFEDHICILKKKNQKIFPILPFTNMWHGMASNNLFLIAWEKNFFFFVELSINNTITSKNVKWQSIAWIVQIWIWTIIRQWNAINLNSLILRRKANYKINTFLSTGRLIH